jgi:hypothetical protein
LEDAIKENADNLILAKKYNVNYIYIDDEYNVEEHLKQEILK